MTLEECNIGDKVKLWCIGWNSYDTETVKVVNKGILVEVSDALGRISRMSSNTPCLKIN